MAERVGAYGHLDHAGERAGRDAYAGQVEQRPDRRPARTTTAERTEVPQPEQPGRGGVQPVQVEVGSQPGDHPAVQRVHGGGRLGQPVDVAAPDRGEAGVEAGRSRGQPPDRPGHRAAPGSAAAPRRRRRPSAPRSRSTWATCPRACTPASVRPAQTRPGGAVDAQDPAQPGLQLTLDRALVRLGRPSPRRPFRRSRGQAASAALPGSAGTDGRLEVEDRPARLDARAARTGSAAGSPPRRTVEVVLRDQARMVGRGLPRIGLGVVWPSRWPAASARRYFSREATRSANAGGINRRLWCRAFGHGSGRRSTARRARARRSRWVSPATASASTTRTFSTSSPRPGCRRSGRWPAGRPRRPARCTPGRARAIGTSDSPVPGPISTISGAWRPNASSRSSVPSGCTDVEVSSRATSSRNVSRCWSQARR